MMLKPTVPEDKVLCLLVQPRMQDASTKLLPKESLYIAQPGKHEEVGRVKNARTCRDPKFNKGRLCAPFRREMN
jgi:hypothetical protein